MGGRAAISLHVCGSFAVILPVGGRFAIILHVPEWQYARARCGAVKHPGSTPEQSSLTKTAPGQPRALSQGILTRPSTLSCFPAQVGSTWAANSIVSYVQENPGLFKGGRLDGTSTTDEQQRQDSDSRAEPALLAAGMKAAPSVYAMSAAAEAKDGDVRPAAGSTPPSGGAAPAARAGGKEAAGSSSGKCGDAASCTAANAGAVASAGAAAGGKALGSGAGANTVSNVSEFLSNVLESMAEGVDEEEALVLAAAELRLVRLTPEQLAAHKREEEDEEEGGAEGHEEVEGR